MAQSCGLLAVKFQLDVCIWPGDVMMRLAECLPRKLEDLSSIAPSPPQNPHLKLGVVAHAFNSSIQEAETGRSLLSLTLAWSI